MGMLRTLRRGLTWTALALAGGAAVVTVRHLLESPQPLHSALDSIGRIDREHGGEIFYNVTGPQDAPPIVLLHDFSPGASNYEYREVFGLLASANRVYAPDWLGYGMSERPNIAYTGEFYAGVLIGFLRDVVAAPATVVGLGRAANVVTRAASDAPRLFSRVVLVSPDIAAGAQAEPTPAQTLVRATQRAFLGIVPYAVLSTRPVLRFLSARVSARRGTGAPADAALDQRYRSAHQFGGQYAPLAMLTGELDLPVRNAFALLEPPALVLIGAADRQRPATLVAEWISVNPRADLDVIPNAGYDVLGDQPRTFVAALDRWIETLPPASSGARLSEAEESEPPGVSASDMEPPESAAVTISGTTTTEPERAQGPEPSPEEDQPQSELAESDPAESLIHGIELSEPEVRPRQPRTTRPLDDETSPQAATGERPSSEEQSTLPRRRTQPGGPQASTRAAPREPSAHAQARGKATQGSGRDRRAQPSAEGTGTGELRHASRSNESTRSGKARRAPSAKTSASQARSSGEGAAESKGAEDSKGTGKGKRTSAR